MLVLLVEHDDLRPRAGKALAAAFDEALGIQNVGGLGDEFAGEFDACCQMGQFIPRSFGPLGRADHGDRCKRDLLFVLHRGAIDVIAPVAQAQAEQDAGGFFGAQAAAREVEHQFGIADRLVFGRQRGARLLAIGQPRLVIAVARACQRQPQDLPVTLDEAFEKLSRLALETRALGAFCQCLFEPFGKYITSPAFA